MRSLSLVMSECSLNERGQGHVSNFCIVDLENFATASRRYTGDMHNSTVVGLFIAKFHCTGPTGPDQTKSADFVADPRGPALTLSVRVRAGCGLMWARETTY